jgi:DNA-binding response OmpR family regulator
MPKYQIDTIKILVADSNIQLRSSLKGVLHQHGFRGIQDASDCENFEEAVRYGNPDLILCDVGLKGGDVCQIIRKVRHNKLGQNPFCAVILFIEEASQDIVRMVSGAGVDDLQIKPVIAQQVIDRVEYLIKMRKPFVVTTDYIGPDRRKADRPGTQKIPQIEVPNSLAMKAKGKFDAHALQAEISKTLFNVNSQKIERHVFQVQYLVDRIVPAYKAKDMNKDVMTMLRRLTVVSKDIVSRLVDSEYGHIASLAETLEKVAVSLWQSGTDPKMKDVNLLNELSSAITATFGLENADTKTVAQIKASIDEKYTS